MMMMIDQLGQIEAKFGDYWLSTKEAESYTSVSSKTLSRAITRGKLKSVKPLGKTYLRSLG